MRLSYERLRVFWDTVSTNAICFRVTERFPDVAIGERGASEGSSILVLQRLSPKHRLQDVRDRHETLNQGSEMRGNTRTTVSTAIF